MLIKEFIKVIDNSDNIFVKDFVDEGIIRFNSIGNVSLDIETKEGLLFRFKLDNHNSNIYYNSFCNNVLILCNSDNFVKVEFDDIHSINVIE